MTKATGFSLTIQEIELPYVGDGFKGHLFAAVPESSKPLTVTADQWRQQMQILAAAKASGFKHLCSTTVELLARGLPTRSSAPWSALCSGHRYRRRHRAAVQRNAGARAGGGELLCSGHYLLLVCVIQSVSGFIPAALTQISEPGIHIARLWYPVVGSREYGLTLFQAGYLAGCSAPVRSSLVRGSPVPKPRRNAKVYAIRKRTALGRKTLKNRAAAVILYPLVYP